jgi:hypothetical protein
MKVTTETIATTSYGSGRVLTAPGLTTHGHVGVDEIGRAKYAVHLDGRAGTLHLFNPQNGGKPIEVEAEFRPSERH